MTLWLSVTFYSTGACIKLRFLVSKHLISCYLGDAWNEFPMSEALSKHLDKRQAKSLISLPAMRLAAQETK